MYRVLFNINNSSCGRVHGSFAGGPKASYSLGDAHRWEKRQVKVFGDSFLRDLSEHDGNKRSDCKGGPVAPLWPLKYKLKLLCLVLGGVGVIFL